METQVKARPIIFSGAMVRALLAGTKTQTRRIIKGIEIVDGVVPGTITYTGKNCYGQNIAPGSLSDRLFGIASNCPYGQPGERLWVRETWRKHYYGNGGVNAPGVMYAADNATRWTPEAGDFSDETWRPSIFMPRWASRILLEIAAVRCERLQDISEADAKAEGCQIGIAPGVVRGALPCVNCGRSQRDHSGVAFACNGTAGVFCPNTYKGGYAMLWEQINGPQSWAANPWVWVVEFKRAEA